MSQIRRLGHQSIMVIEDNNQDFVLLKHAFKAAGFPNPICAVQTGNEAICYLSGADKYDDRTRYPLPMLIFLDLQLPRDSGLNILEWIRQQPKINRIPIIVLTASERHTDVKRAYELGANSYIVKPTNHDALVRMVEAIKRYWLTLNVYPPVSPFPARL